MQTYEQTIYHNMLSTFKYYHVTVRDVIYFAGAFTAMSPSQVTAILS